MEDQELLKKRIIYSGMELKTGEYPRTIIVDEDGKKYLIWHTKKDGTESKASEQLKKLIVGMSVEVNYVSEKRTFTSKEGKEVTYDSLTARFFSDPEEVIPSKPEYDFNKTKAPEQGETAPEGQNSPQGDPGPEEPNEVTDEDIKGLPF